MSDALEANTGGLRREGVGPVLHKNSIGLALLEALRAQNSQLEVLDRGSYLRVLSPGRCVLRRDAVELELGSSFRLPGDLEAVMSSFKGKMTIFEDEVIWESGRL